MILLILNPASFGDVTPWILQSKITNLNWCRITLPSTVRMFQLHVRPSRHGKSGMKSFLPAENSSWDGDRLRNDGSTMVCTWVQLYWCCGFDWVDHTGTTSTSSINFTWESKDHWELRLPLWHACFWIKRNLDQSLSAMTLTKSFDMTRVEVAVVWSYRLKRRQRRSFSCAEKVLLVSTATWMISMPC